MDEFSRELNDILVEAYHNILRQEELALQKATANRVSIREIHLLECVGDAGEAGITNSALADKLNITRPSVTAAVNRLLSKGFVTKAGSQEDGRQVRVRLTQEGKKLHSYHSLYHKEMVRHLAENFTQEEKECLLRGIRRLNQFFNTEFGEEL